MYPGRGRAAFTELGGTIETNAEVIEIEVQHGQARGVITRDGRRFPAAAVISNADAAVTYKES
ncbi:MAG: hypothetical protein U0232_07175 [Thermomicrobiales bacterium]